MAKKKDSLEKKKGGVPSKQVLYQKAAANSLEAIECLVKIMREGDADSNKVAAARTLLNKSIPDLKENALKNEDGSAFLIKLVDYGGNNTTPAQTKNGVGEVD